MLLLANFTKHLNAFECVCPPTNNITLRYNRHVFFFTGRTNESD